MIALWLLDLTPCPTYGASEDYDDDDDDDTADDFHNCPNENRFLL